MDDLKRFFSLGHVADHVRGVTLNGGGGEGRKLVRTDDGGHIAKEVVPPNIWTTREETRREVDRLDEKIDHNRNVFEAELIIVKSELRGEIATTKETLEDEIEHSADCVEEAVKEWSRDKFAPKTVYIPDGDSNDSNDQQVELSELAILTFNTSQNHLVDFDNPHQVTKRQVGLGNVDNTSDMDKPVSTATREAIDEVAEKVSSVYRYKGSVADYDDLPEYGNEPGDVYNIRSDGMNVAWVEKGSNDEGYWDDLGPSLQGYLTEKKAAEIYLTMEDAAATYLTKGQADEYYDPYGAASEVDEKYSGLPGQVQDISSGLSSHIGDTSNPHGVTKDQVGLGNVDNTSDADKPISDATQTALDGKVDISHTGDVSITGRLTVTGSNKSTIFDGEKIYRQNGSNPGKAYLFPDSGGKLALQSEIPPPQVQADWDEDDPNDVSFIRNKPEITNSLVSPNGRHEATVDDNGVIQVESQPQPIGPNDEIEAMRVALGLQEGATFADIRTAMGLQEGATLADARAAMGGSGQPTVRNVAFVDQIVQSDWLEDDSNDPSFIRNKPELTGTIIEKVWSQLKAMRDGGTLVPGQQYRITDYVATTTQQNTQSANNPFDIIVTADAPNKLNEVARAVKNASDTYFTAAGCKLEAWVVWYCIDNDTSRFVWADDSANGRGVVYRLIDEWDNDLPYDFKSIKFAVSGQYKYTFDQNGQDASCISLNCYSNKMQPDSIYFDGAMKQALNFNVFGGYCSRNTFGYSCRNNTFGKNCHSNTFGGASSNNTFEQSCYSNTFGSSCMNNRFGSGCIFNVFHSACSYNEFGSDCLYCNFGIECRYIKFGSSSVTKDKYRHITVEGGNNHIYLDYTTVPSQYEYYCNITIAQGVNNPDPPSWKTITIIKLPGDKSKITFQPANSRVISM